MRAALYFDLDEPQDREEHRLCVHGKWWCLVAWRVNEAIRKQLRSTEEEAVIKALEEVDDVQCGAMAEYGLSLDDVS